MKNFKDTNCEERRANLYMYIPPQNHVTMLQNDINRGNTRRYPVTFALKKMLQKCYTPSQNVTAPLKQIAANVQVLCT